MTRKQSPSVHLSLFPLLLVFGTVAPCSAQDEPKAEQIATILESIPGDGPGVVVAVLREGKVIYTGAQGLAAVASGRELDGQTICLIGSITKPFTALAVLQLSEKGLLSLDDPAAKHLPDEGLPEKITIRHLLTHTSGYVPDAELLFTPGDRVEYSNDGYRLLGKLIEAVSGATYGEFLQDSIFEPCGMDSTGYGDEDTFGKDWARGYAFSDSGYLDVGTVEVAGAFSAGGIYSTLEDLCKWETALLRGRLVSAELLDAAFTSVVLSDGTQGAYAYGWMTGDFRGLRSVGHGGDITGFNSYLARFPDDGLSVIALSNAGMRPAGPVPVGGDIAHRIAAVYLADKLGPEEKPAAREITLTDEQAAILVGSYRLKAPQEVLEASGEILKVEWTDQKVTFGSKLGVVPLAATSPTEFTGPNAMKFKFVIGKDGKDGKAAEISISAMGLRHFQATRVD